MSHKVHEVYLFHHLMEKMFSCDVIQRQEVKLKHIDMKLNCESNGWTRCLVVTSFDGQEVKL
jgi:hypothetical protein